MRAFKDASAAYVERAVSAILTGSLAAVAALPGPVNDRAGTFIRAV